MAHYWGCAELFEAWTSPEEVFQILKRCSDGQPCDITGIEDYRQIDAQGGIQWPCTAAAEAEDQQRRLFEDGRFYHPDGRAKFLFEDPRPLTEPPTDRYPFILLTGRGTASQWHTQTRTCQSAVLRKLYPAKQFVEINPADARRLQIGPGDRTIVESQRGQVVAQAVLTHAVQAGQVFISMHDHTANQLTDAVFDPYSKQPSYKSCAVRLLRS